MRYIVNGGKPLAGTIEVAGAKNVSLKLIIAALMCKGKTVLHNVPRIRDVEAILDIINALGGTAKFVDHTVEIENTLTSHLVSLEQAACTRVSFLLMVPLLHTFGSADVPNPGGCRLGARPVDRLAQSITQFGGKITYDSADGYYHASAQTFIPGEYHFAKPSHTGTEFVLMHAAAIEGESIIRNAALEPEIDELIAFLNAAGARIQRVGNDIEVAGVAQLNAPTARIGSDRNEVISFIVLSALCKGSIVIKNVELKPIETFLRQLAAVGITTNYTAEERSLRLIVPETIKPSDVTTSPHPGFMTDWQPLWAVLMTQATGVSTIHETVFEQRFNYVNQLIKYGAHISFYDPHVDDLEQTYQFDVPLGTTPLNQAIRITGPVTLHNAATVMTDMRAGACLLFAALMARGRSIIDGAQQIERGYESLGERLSALGANIQVYED